jgi:hypothetical protein
MSADTGAGARVGAHLTERVDAGALTTAPSAVDVAAAE